MPKFGKNYDFSKKFGKQHVISSLQTYAFRQNVASSYFIKK